MEKEYDGLFENPLEEIHEDIFFRADNFEGERWYNELRKYLAIGVCQPEREDTAKMQKALKILGFSTCTDECDGKVYVVPQ